MPDQAVGFMDSVLDSALEEHPELVEDPEDDA